MIASCNKLFGAFDYIGCKQVHTFRYTAVFAYIDPVIQYIQQVYFVVSSLRCIEYFQVQLIFLQILSIVTGDGYVISYVV